MIRTSLRKPDGSARLTVKLTKCKACRAPFVKTRMEHKFCGAEACAVVAAEEATAKRAKAAKKAAALDRKETREKLAELDGLGVWLKRAEAAVNRYVRLRDAGKGCVSCDLPAAWGGQWHASHFRSVGAATAVRFNLWNVHKACSVCNNWRSGNLSEYEPRLRALIGDEKVDWLRSQNQVVKYSREYLERLQKVFNKKARRQEKRNAVLCA